MIKLKDFLNPKGKTDEYEVTNFDIKNGWNWKDVDHLMEMGFELAGDTRLKLSDKKEFDETLNAEIYKEKSSGDYILMVNERKHHFKSFTSMLNYIDKYPID